MPQTHTIGPWNISDAGMPPFQITTKVGPINVSPATANGLADAWLISAAPDLLAALKELLDSNTTSPGSILELCELERVIKVAREANTSKWSTWTIGAS